MTLKCGGELRLHDLADELFGERCDSEVSYRLAEPRVALDDVHGANETACEGIRRGALTVSECDGRETLGDPWDVRPILSALNPKMVSSGRKRTSVPRCADGPRECAGSVRRPRSVRTRARSPRQVVSISKNALSAEVGTRPDVGPLHKSTSIASSLGLVS
jgi:hypothetical protein